LNSINIVVFLVEVSSIIYVKNLYILAGCEWKASMDKLSKIIHFSFLTPTISRIFPSSIERFSRGTGISLPSADFSMVVV